VCPWNNKTGNAPATFAAEFQPQPEFVHPELSRLAEMSEKDFRQIFRGSPVKRTKYSGLRRNVAIAMGNSGKPEFIPLLEKMCEEADPLLAEHAQWALKRLRSGSE
jgi:epoxyqueuosine reductase